MNLVEILFIPPGSTQMFLLPLPFFLFLNLFIWLHQVLVVECGIFVAALRLFITERGLLSSCGAWALECAGSVVAARGLSCSAACGILLLRPGIEPVSPALEGRFLTTGPPGKSPPPLFLKSFSGQSSLKKIFFLIFLLFLLLFN